MSQPIPTHIMRQYMRYYREVRLRWQMGEAIKMTALLKKKAAELGVGFSTGYARIKKRRVPA